MRVLNKRTYSQDYGVPFLGIEPHELTFVRNGCAGVSLGHADYRGFRVHKWPNESYYCYVPYPEGYSEGWATSDGISGVGDRGGAHHCGGTRWECRHSPTLEAALRAIDTLHAEGEAYLAALREGGSYER